MNRIPDWLRKPLPTLASVGMFCAAFPPFNVSLLVLVALAPWLAALRDTDARGARRSGLLFGAAFFGYQMWWMVTFVAQWTDSYALALVPWAICVGLGSLHGMLLGWIVWACWAQRRAWVIPLVWAGWEGFRAYIWILAFPWGNLAHPLWRYPEFVQHAALGTVFLVSAWLVISNVVIASLVWPPTESPAKERAPRPQVLVRMGLVFLACLLGSTARYAFRPQVETVPVTAGQPGVDLAFGDPATERERLAAALQELQFRAAVQGTRFLLLPEGVARGGPTLPPDSPFGPRPEVNVVFGGNRVEGGKTYQSLFAYDGEWQAADKTRLVVFGEFVPLRGILPIPEAFRLPGGDLTPGTHLQTPTVAGVRLGAMICFEGLFPDLADRHSQQGAQMLAVMSIDDWYRTTPAWDQLWQSSVWRSIESGLPVVRSGSMGRTLYTDERGTLVATVAPDGIQALRAEVRMPIHGSDAMPGRFAFVWLAWASMLVIGGISLWDRFRSKPPSE